MNPANLAIFFEKVYLNANLSHTVFISMKYRLHLIYIQVGWLYSICDKVWYVLKVSGVSFSALFIGILKRIWKI